MTSSHSPILRIAILLFVLAASARCSRLGLGNDGSPTAPSPPPTAGSTIVYDAVGASDADGVGSSFPCLPYTDCPNGMGYPQISVRSLTAQGFTVTLQNLGIPTAVIGPDFEALGQQYNRVIVGNFIVQEMPFVRTNATLVTIFAGGNEVNTITSALGAGAGASDQLGYIDAQVRAFGADYTTLLAGIRVRAPRARIVALNVPNLAGLPLLTSASLAQRQAAQRAAVGMAKLVNALPNVTVVDLLCDTRSYQPSIYSSDGFHPNDSGYAYISSEVVRATTLASYPAPQSSCAGMTVVPNP
jgi:lysophospholipase L1-like esterase